MLIEFWPELLGEDGLLATCLEPESEDDEREADHRTPGIGGDTRPEDGDQDAGVDRMPDAGVGARANQLVIGLDRDIAAPIPAEMKSRPESEEDPGHRKHRANAQQPFVPGENR